MSADNYIVIFQEPDGKYRGYMGFMSDEVADEELRKGAACMVADSKDDACNRAAEIYCEYGYSFADMPGTPTPPPSATSDTLSRIRAACGIPDAAEACRTILKFCDESPWIPTAERMPVEGVTVLLAPVWNDATEPLIGEWCGQIWDGPYMDPMPRKDVAFWMPLPPLPPPSETR